MSTKLRRKLLPRMVLEFKHVGAQCPACGYVYTNGFSAMKEDERPTGVPKGETITPCTRCRRILAIGIEKGGVRVLNDVERMLLTDGDREALALMKAVLDEYQAELS